MDEDFFTIEEQYNNLNKMIYVQTSLEMHSEGAGMPSPFLRQGLVGGVPSGGDTSSFLQERGETGVRVYQEDVLQGVVKQLNMTFSVVGNRSSSRTQFLAKSQDDSGVVAEEHSGPYQRRGLALGESRPNSRDYKLWAVLEDMTFQKRQNNLDSLKRSLAKAATEIPLETVRAAIAEWPKRLKPCLEAEGGHFEWHYYK
jgi:hypothetical protein